MNNFQPSQSTINEGVKICGMCQKFDDSCAETEYYAHICNDFTEKEIGKMNPRLDIIENAKECVLQNRQDIHGEPENSFKEIANMWNAYLNNKETIEDYDVANMMIMLKMIRSKTTPSYKDNWLDMIGYASCGYELTQNKK